MLIPLPYVIYFFVHNKTRLNMQKLHNTYWRNCHGFYSNYIHSKHATRMFIIFTVTMPLACSWPMRRSYHLQAFGSIEFTFTNHIRAGGPGDNSIPQQMVICQNCANANSTVKITNQRP